MLNFKHICIDSIEMCESKNIERKLHSNRKYIIRMRRDYFIEAREKEIFSHIKTESLYSEVIQTSDFKRSRHILLRK
jgi:hypothetical protein